ncbi:MAG: right-handed parallel beta-helix repeat-containing protein [Chthoniobacterales bacterium]
MKLNKLKTLSAVAFAAALVTICAGTTQAAPCSVPSGPYPTIQSAVDNPTCDPIIVAAGTYVENIGISRGLSLRGPNFGISPNSGTRVAEATLNGGGSTTIRISTTQPVTIDGFSFSGGTGAFVDSYTSGNSPVIKHNIFTAQVNGFFFNEPALFTFEDNYLHDLTDCGSCEGVFIAGNWDGSSGTVASIKNNVWLMVGGPGMNLSNVKGTISGNSFSYVTYYAALLANGTNVDISGNAFDHTINPDLTVRTWGAGIRFYTPSAGFGARITGNTFSANYVGVGVRQGSPTADITGMNVYAHQNNFVGNTAAGIRHDGLGTFNATCNWWNSATGPTNPGNPGGTGDAVDGSGPVTFAPWLNAAAPGGNCFPVAATVDQCKNGGWTMSIRANGTTFKNQGDCIQYVNTGR